MIVMLELDTHFILKNCRLHSSVVQFFSLCNFVNFDLLVINIYDYYVLDYDV